MIFDKTIFSNWGNLINDVELIMPKEQLILITQEFGISLEKCYVGHG